MVYTASEIVALAGVDPKEIGKVRVRIAGLPVNRPDHLVNMGNATRASVIVGVEKHEVELPSGEGTHTDAARTHLEAWGRAQAAAEPFNARSKEILARAQKHMNAARIASESGDEETSRSEARKAEVAIQEAHDERVSGTKAVNEEFDRLSGR